jgi:MoaA/NifB/PqqE/SkfB family radical SAM enzyme
VPLFFLVIDPEGNVFPCDYLQADTRPDSQEYHEMRSGFAVGNVFTHGDAVPDRLGTVFREKVHFLPGRGYEECGSCTRFFELNTFLSGLAREPMPGSSKGSGMSSMGAIADTVAEQFL